ncbi:MAG: hypothetical protein K0Q50_1337 [Vampirovibrio sp.]|jgi:Flp pilus assembly pilin Flp|nr:hypothetical protein [Vampirovibrio sp.]
MRKHYPGVTTTEYALFAGLLAVTAIAGLTVLGGSVNGLFSGADTRLSAPNTLSVLAPVQPAKTIAATNAQAPPSQTLLQISNPTAYKGSGYYAVVTDPATGMPKLQLTDGTAGEVKNVSSVDGNQLNALGSLMLARKLDQIASEQTDPQLQDYYGQMAKLAYYMGAAEGELDDVNGLRVTKPLNGKRYTNADALRDLNQYHGELATLMQNPPAGVNSQTFGTVMPLAAEVYNIGHNYVNHLNTFIKPNGEVTTNFKTNPSARDGGPAAGSTFREIDIVIPTTPSGAPSSKSYEQYIPYTDLKNTVASVLKENLPISEPVETTWNDATVIDTHSFNSKSRR